ncbi:hypothetical protein J4408_02055 [Candidatus Pacearchaeota archaeon]|nr:hypothetical protein [Candidatus Pacearchaeota archaeon]
MEKPTFYKIIQAGIQAPSGDNIQPWKVISGINFDSFTLKFVKHKKDFFDVNNFATFLSCGAFLENMSIATEKFGFKSIISINNNNKSDIIAEIKFKPNNKAKANNLYQEIFKRSTSRVSYKKDKLSKNFYNGIKNFQRKNKFAKIRLFDGNNEKLKDIIYIADIIRLGTKGAHETLAANIRITKEEINRRDGLDYRTLGIPFAQKLTSRLLKSWAFAKLAEKTKLNRIMAYVSTRKLLNDSSGIAILTINKNSKETAIKAGMLIERIWLLLTKYNGYSQPFAALSFFLKRIKLLNAEGFTKKQKNKLIKLKEELYTLAKIENIEELAFIFRFGRANKPKIRSLRRDINSFIKEVIF